MATPMIASKAPPIEPLLAMKPQRMPSIGYENLIPAPSLCCGIFVRPADEGADDGKIDQGVRTQQMHLMHVGSPKRLADCIATHNRQRRRYERGASRGGRLRSRNGDKRLAGIVALARLRCREETREDFATDRQGTNCKREMVGTYAK